MLSVVEVVEVSRSVSFFSEMHKLQNFALSAITSLYHTESYNLPLERELNNRYNENKEISQF